MADLNDFMDTPAVTTGTFQLEDQQPPSYINEATAKSAAAHAVALAGPENSNLNTYDTVTGELSTGNKSDLFEKIKSDVATGDMQRARQLLPDIVADPSILDQTKKAVVSSALDPNSGAYNAQNLVSRRAITTPLVGETREQEDTRASIAATLQAMNDVKTQRQALYNNFVAKNNPDIGSKVGSILGGLIPLTTGARTAAQVGQIIPDASWWDKVESFILPGEGKQKVINYLNGLPLDQQMEAARNTLDIVKNTSGILPDSTNNANAVQSAAQFLQGDGYDAPTKVMDDVTGLLDVVAIAGLAGKAAKVSAEAGLASRQAAEGDRVAGLHGGIGKPPSSGGGSASEDVRSSASRDFTRSSVQPTSVAENLKDSNPQQLRLTHNVVASDATDEAAQALYGTTRNEAIASDHAPEMAHPDGSINNKVSEPDHSPDNALDPDIADFVNNDGFTSLENSEKARARTQIVNNYSDALTPTARTEMWALGGVTSEEFPEGVRIQAIYGPSNTGYADPDEARELFKYQMRDWGITDKDITILERNGSSYRPYQPNKFDVQNNGSGESSASVEAINRNKAELKNGQLRFVINRDDTITPIQGVDSVDQKAYPGQVIVQRGVGKDEWTVLSNGNDLSKDVVAGKLNRNMAKLNTAVQERMKNTPGNSGGGDYLIQIDYEHRFKPGDIDEWFNTSVKRNLFDMVAPVSDGTHGSLTQHLFPSTATLDPLISLSALTTSDKAAGLEKALLQPLKKFNKLSHTLSADRSAKMMAKVQDANLKSYTPTYTNMVAEGFSEPEIQALQTWRKFWDNVWHLDNLDYNRTRRAQGWMKFVNSANKTLVEVHPVKQRSSITSSIDVADPVTGALKTLTPKDIDAIYEKGGLLARLDMPVKVGEDFGTHIVSMETPDSYLRAINDGDISLNYRKGYYNVSYKGPWFIDRVWHDANGGVKNKHTVYSSDNKKDADLVASRLDKNSDDDSVHIVRLDKKLSNRKQNTWDLYKAQGRSSQRWRGERLMDATSAVQGPAHGHILSPIEAAVSSARSISRRATTREWLDITKSRFIANRADYLPKNQYGKTVFPASKKDIAIQSGKRGTKKGLADARTEFDYIRSMENGYVNSIDDFWKAGLNTIADILGEKHLTPIEKGARGMAKASLSGEAKKLSFALFLALNPVRQFLVQAHQGILLGAINPTWLATRAAPQMVYLAARQLGMSSTAVPEAFFRALGMSRKQADEMYHQLERSGLASGIDKSSIVRGSLNDMADMMIKNSARSTLSKILRPIKTAGHISRLAGFDSGEWVNIVMSWAGHRDLAVQAGLDLARSDIQATIAARARNFTGSMNNAGDMPYNSNELSPIMQFQQQAHKMFALMTVNRAVSRADRLKLVALNTILFGIPTTMGTLLWEAISSDKDSNKDAKTKTHAVELLQRGAENAAINGIASAVSGDKVDIDTSSLNALNMYGTSQLVHSLFTSTPGEILANTPTGSLFFGGNPRLTKFVRTTAQYFHLIQDNDSPVKFSDEAKAFANLSSGLSNAFQAAYSMKYGKAISTYSGNTTDPQVSTPEAMAKFFGFSTWDSVQKAAENEEFYNASTDFENDVNTWYKNFRVDMARSDITPDEIEFVRRVHNKAFMVWGDNDRASRIIESNLLRDASKGDLTFYKRATQSLGIMSYQDWRQLVLNSNQIDDATKQQILQIGSVFNQEPQALKGTGE